MIRVIKATLVLKGLVERRVQLANRVSKVFKAQKETKAIRVTLVRLAHRGLREILVRLDLRVQKVMPLLMQTLPQSSSSL